MATLHLPEAQIKFKNFEGREYKFNPLGSRRFTIFFDYSELDSIMLRDWPIKYSVERTDRDLPIYAYIPVKVRFDEINEQDLTPKVFLTLKGEKSIETRELDEDTIKILDWAPFTYCDVTIHSQPWDFGTGKSGVMALLDELHVII